MKNSDIDEFPDIPDIDESEFPSETNDYGMNGEESTEGLKSVWMITCFDSKTNEIVQLNNAVFDSQDAALMQLQDIMRMCPPVNLMYDIKEVPIRTMDGFL